MPSYRDFVKLNDGDLVIYILEGSKNGYWYVRFKNPLDEGSFYVRKSTGFRNKSEATRMALDLYRDYYSREHLGLATGGISLKEAVEKFGKDFDKIGKISVYAAYKAYWKDFFGDSDMAKIKSDKIREYFEYRIKKAKNKENEKTWNASNGNTVSVSTLNMERGLLRRLFLFCKSANYIHSVPGFPRNFKGWAGTHSLPDNMRRGRFNLEEDYSKIIMPYFSMIRKGLTNPKWTPELLVLNGEWSELNPYVSMTRNKTNGNKRNKGKSTHKVFCKQNTRYDAAVFWFYCTLISNSGIRPSELVKLKHKDISIVKDSKTEKYFTLLNVSKEVSKVKKGRTVICRDFHSSYERYLIYKKELEYRFNKEINKYDFLFPATESGGVGYRGKIYHTVSRHLKRLGLHKRLNEEHGVFVYYSAYSFRSFYITMRIRNGIDIYALSKNVGASPKIIMKHYDVCENIYLRDRMTRHLIKNDFSKTEEVENQLKNHAVVWKL